MLELKENLILYHGSYCEVLRPDLKKCAKMKDFGQGFRRRTILPKIYRQLYDDTTKLWWTGPSYIAEMYLEEIALKQ